MNYYSNSLHSNSLRRCYEVAPPRVKQFLEAEIAFVLDRIRPDDTVLDLGCGYGRVAIRLAEKARKVVGIDISKDNIVLAREFVAGNERCEFHTMDATTLAFDDGSFDLVICAQNGISAFHVDPVALLQESIRVTKKGGTLLFSSYSERFWDDRLDWFRIQAKEGLIGEIDEEKTGDGHIICKDGFTATTFSAADFLDLSSRFNVRTSIHEVDNSSLFCEMVVD